MERAIAYFTMEAGLEPGIPTYSGGLGVLAGDTLRAAADLRIPMVGVSLLYRRGYFRQHLDRTGNQEEIPTPWAPEDHLEEMVPRVEVEAGGRTVAVRAGRYCVRGNRGFDVPVYLLDTELPENDPADQALTDYLYGGDGRYRLTQEVILGISGVAMLKALGHTGIRRYHMNEGHSALLTLALMEDDIARRRDGLPAGVSESDEDEIRQRCVFTTHTPVPAGHDKFPWELVNEVLGERRTRMLRERGWFGADGLNLTQLALNLSHFINGVAMRHGQISRDMFPGYPINSITNGVHPETWTAQPFQDLFDWYTPEWRHSAMNLRHAVAIPIPEVREAHVQSKRRLLTEVQRRTDVALDPDVMTIGFARRATAYKRPDMIFADVERLRTISKEVGKIQVLFGGKAHPRDEGGKAAIRSIFEAARMLGRDVPVVYIEDYDMAMGHALCSGVDLWLNTPLRPHEASGTSGMKAALNGVPSFSVLDGWWIEGHVEGATGWAIGDGWRAVTEGDNAREVESLYAKLARTIVPLFYGDPAEYARVMRTTIALNGSFFNSQRMMQQYLDNAYRL